MALKCFEVAKITNEVERTCRSMRDVARSGNPIFTTEPEQADLRGAYTPDWAKLALGLSVDELQKLEEEIDGITKEPDTQS